MRHFSCEGEETGKKELPKGIVCHTISERYMTQVADLGLRPVSYFGREKFVGSENTLPYG